MDPDLRTGLILGGILFCLFFAALTILALPDAQPNFGSLVTFGASFGIIAVVLIGLIGALRNPPDD